VEAFDNVWDIPWSRNPLDLANLLKAPTAIREIVRQEGYDIVHVHTPVAAFVTRWALRTERRNKKLKVIYTAHGFHFIKGAPFYKNLVFIILEKMAGYWTDYLVVINKEDEDAALKYRLVKKEHLLHMPGIGIDSAYYDPSNISKNDLNEVRDELGLNSNENYFLMVGEFNNNKFQSEAVSALSVLGNPEIHLAFAGNGTIMKNVKNISEDLGISDRVHFLGYRIDIPRLMKASLGVLLTSRREGLPRCILEAMSLEVPVIATNIRGARELLEDGAGILYQVGDIDGLKKALEYIINNPEEAKKMGLNARKDILEKYESSKIIEMHEKLYYRALTE